MVCGVAPDALQPADAGRRGAGEQLAQRCAVQFSDDGGKGIVDVSIRAAEEIVERSLYLVAEGGKVASHGGEHTLEHIGCDQHRAQVEDHAQRLRGLDDVFAQLDKHAADGNRHVLDVAERLPEHLRDACFRCIAAPGRYPCRC